MQTSTRAPLGWVGGYLPPKDHSQIGAFSFHDLGRIGLPEEGRGSSVSAPDTAGCGAHSEVLCDLDGEHPRPEREDPELESCRISPPDLWVNVADRQGRHGVFGEMRDRAYQRAGDDGGAREPQRGGGA